MSLKKSSTILMALSLCFAFSACGDDDDDDLITLSSLVGETVQVTLDGDLGTITFDLGDESPEGDTLTAFTDYLGDNTITVEVSDEDTSVSYAISSGTLVASNPVSAGEYRVAILGSSANITFWNEFDGKSLSAGGSYSATVTVLSNDYFADESFTRTAAVSH